jgi:hypothetical protein
MSSIPSTRPTKAWVLYCTVWDLHTVDSDSKIEMVQRRSARYACNIYQNTSSVSDMLITLNWPTLAESSCFTKLYQFVAIQSDTILIPADSKTRITHQQTFKHIFISKDTCRYSFFPYTVTQWNNLPEPCIQA